MSLTVRYDLSYQLLVKQETRKQVRIILRFSYYINFHYKIEICHKILYLNKNEKMITKHNTSLTSLTSCC